VTFLLTAVNGMNYINGKGDATLTRLLKHILHSTHPAHTSVQYLAWETKGLTCGKPGFIPCFTV